MAGTYLHPGVYIEEIPSGSKPIEGVSTSNAVFVGYTDKGVIGEASLIFKWDDYVSSYGGIRSESDELGLAVNTFYLNGGAAAYVARLAANALASNLPSSQMMGRAGGTAAAVNVLAITASSQGKWGDAVYVKATDSGDGLHFKLEVGEMVDGSFVPSEIFDRLTMTAEHIRRYNSRFGLLYIDLDGFKQVNDTLGHAAGDELLKAVGGQFLAMCRKSDTVARLGGDEFAILSAEIDATEAVETLAARIIAAFEHPIRLAAGEVMVGASIGIALFPADSDTPEDLVRLADKAMYAAKAQGKNQFKRASADDPAKE